jgi:dTDP-4-dehydrorhamnose reductase
MGNEKKCGSETNLLREDNAFYLRYDEVVNVLIFGAKGSLGQQFLSLYPGAAAPDVDIADPVAVAKALDSVKPDVVINAAGKTGRPNVDWCEDHKMETLHSNVTGPLVLLEECSKRGIYWVHLSSGCVYDGDNGGKGFSEDDPPNFFGSFYSRTKAWSEMALREFPLLILRLRMPFDGTTAPRNLITKLRGYARVLDVENSLTYLPDFLRAAGELIARRRMGTYNVVNEGAISPYRIMELYREMVDPSHTFERLTLRGLPEVTKTGRSNCILSTKKLMGEGIAMRPVELAVREALEGIKRVQ